MHKFSNRTDIKRERLLEAAQEIFLEKGVHAASMSDIAKKAELSPPHIYNFYKGKADLAMAVQMRMSKELFENFRQNMCDDGKLDNSNCIENLLDPRRSALMLTLTTEATRDPKLMEQIRKNNEIFRDLIFKYYEVDENDIEHLSRMQLLQAMYTGLAVVSLISPIKNKEVLKELLYKTDAWIARKHPVDHLGEFNPDQNKKKDIKEETTK